MFALLYEYIQCDYFTYCIVPKENIQDKQLRTVM